jgi:hypothetical protein
VGEPGQPVSADERRRLITEAAYFRANERGFGSDPIGDWLVAEKEVDAALSRRNSDPPNMVAFHWSKEDAVCVKFDPSTNGDHSQQPPSTSSGFRKVRRRS